MPFCALKAQSKTARCSSRDVRRAFDRAAVIDVSEDVLDVALVVAELAERARATVLLTIFIRPPPTSVLYFTSAMSGSMPVVSQSIMKLIVPVGAMTVAWELR